MSTPESPISAPRSPVFVVVTRRNAPEPGALETVHIPRGARKAYGLTQEGSGWATIPIETADVALVQLPNLPSLYPMPYTWALVEAAELMGHGHPSAPKVLKLWRRRKVGRTVRSPFRQTLAVAQAEARRLGASPPLYISPSMVDIAEVELRSFLGDQPHLRAAAEALLRLAREDAPPGNQDAPPNA